MTDISKISQIPVLDHGFIRLIDTMGEDSSIVQAARVSYGKGTKTSRDDEGLIRYLMRHKHNTPFEMCEAKFHLRMPIFVARQWMRHRTGSYNEISARYSVLKEEFFIPAREALAQQSKNNAQARSVEIEDKDAGKILQILHDHGVYSFEKYLELLEDLNLARELSRTVIPLSAYTEFYWKVNLHNLLHFLELRSGEGAQPEIRVYAQEIMKLVENWVPIVYQAFLDYRIEATSFSAKEMKLLEKMLAGEKPEWKESDLLAGEWREFCKKVNLTND